MSHLFVKPPEQKQWESFFTPHQRELPPKAQQATKSGLLPHLVDPKGIPMSRALQKSNAPTIPGIASANSRSVQQMTPEKKHSLNRSRDQGNNDVPNVVIAISKRAGSVGT